MDFSAIFQIKNKKFWWMDVIFYFVISLLIATTLCYFIFLTKNNIQREEIKKETAALQTVGTEQQKEYEKEVISYQKKINDFSNLLKNHEFASNAFAFMQAQTMPNVWFRQFSLDGKNNGVQLSGESDDMDAFSRQVAVFEGNKYVKSIGTLNSSLGDSARVGFNIGLVLDQNIFSYLSSLPLALNPAALQEQTPSQQEEGVAAGNLLAQADASIDGQQGIQPLDGALSGEKLITSFHFLLNPEVIGVINETNHTVTLNVPYGTDVKNLTPSIVTSPGATIMPPSNVTQDFTNLVTYIVTAEDGSVQNYWIRVVPSVSSNINKKSSQSGLTTLITILLVVIAIVAIAVIFLFIWKRMKSRKTRI